MGRGDYNLSLSPEESNRILKALERYMNYTRNELNSREQDHSRFVNACDILNNVYLTGTQTTDLFLKGDLGILEKIISYRRKQKSSK